jgi:replicative DNA helicase
VTHAFQKAQSLNLWIDDQTSLNLLAIRSKARFIKRRAGLDLLVIDQLSFITGSKAENKAYELGDYTRGLLALAKELDCAIVLLAQLNRECEKRMNKRPMLSDLSSSGSIEQDASTVIFLYRDEVYNLDTQDKGICEVITAKQRQGEIGACALTYIGNQTRFEDLAFHWKPAEIKDKPMPRGFD